MALVNPGVPLATASVFRARTGAFQTPAALPAGWDDAAAMAAALRGLENGLEAAARGLCPAISAALAALAAQPGCLLARMSGSGATCFGLFATAAAAAAAAASIAAAGAGMVGLGRWRERRRGALMSTGFARRRRRPYPRGAQRHGWGVAKR